LNRILLISLLSIFAIVCSAQVDKQIPESYTNAMDWLTENSNAYSGILNEKQTWVVSYDGFEVTDEYYWNNELRVRVQYDIRNIDKATNETRFQNSVALYPKPGNTTDISVTRFDDGVPQSIEGDYYNLMIDPAIKTKAHQKMLEVLETIQVLKEPTE